MKIIFFANTDWYLYNFRVPLAKHASEMGYEVLLVSPPGKYHDKFIEHGLRWSSLPMNRRNVNPLKELAVLYRIIRLYRKERPTIVHHFTLKCVIYGSIAASIVGIERRINAITGLGYIFTSQSLKAKCLKLIVKYLLRILLRNKNSRSIVQNKDDYNMLIKNDYTTKTNLFLVPSSGVNIDLFRYKNKQNKVKSKIVVLMATRLLVEKGVREYIGVAQSISEARDNVRFLLAGLPDPGNPNSISETELNEWRQVGVPKILGHVDNMSNLLESVDLVVLPSYYGEGIPRILIEAAASGIPIVTTTVPGCREAVDHGGSGFLVPPNKSLELATSIEILLDSPELRQSMGMLGRKKAEQLFDEKITIDKTLQVYQSY